MNTDKTSTPDSLGAATGSATYVRYRLTDEDIKRLQEASAEYLAPVIPIFFECERGQPTPEDRLDDAWKAIAARLGVDWESFRRTDTGDIRDVDAVPLSPNSD